MIRDAKKLCALCATSVSSVVNSGKPFGVKTGI